MQQDDASSSSYTARGTKSAQCRVVLWGGRAPPFEREERTLPRDSADKCGGEAERRREGKEPLLGGRSHPTYTKIWDCLTPSPCHCLTHATYQYDCLLLSQTPPPSVRTLYSNGPLDGGRAAVGLSL